MKLDGTVVLVTGGGTGIGRSACLELAGEGAAVAVNYSRSRAEAEETVAEIQAAGGRSMAVLADVSDEAAVEAMVRRVAGEWGRLDVLVNNAGMTYFVEHTDLDALTGEMWDRMLAVNLKGVFFCCRAAARVMRQQKRGRIVNVASVAGLTGKGSSIGYAASKAGVLSVTKSLAMALAPEILVNAVAPGFVETRWTAGRDAFRAKALEGTPLERVAVPEDVAEAILYLAKTDFVTGQVLTVDGGRNL
jgi:3-oxoacyl-[acyl-carrier protein] reductase